MVTPRIDKNSLILRRFFVFSTSLSLIKNLIILWLINRKWSLIYYLIWRKRTIFIWRLKDFLLFQMDEISSPFCATVFSSWLLLFVVQFEFFNYNIGHRIIALSYIENLRGLPFLFYFTQNYSWFYLMIVLKISLVLYHNLQHVLFTNCIACYKIFCNPF